MNIWSRACYRLLILIHGQPLYCKALIVSNLWLLTYFIRSYSLKFLDIILWILSSRNIHFVLLIYPWIPSNLWFSWITYRFWVSFNYLPSFRSFGNLDNFWMFILYQFQNTCIFLNNKFKKIDIRNIQSVDVSNSMNKIRNKFFFFLTVFNNNILFVLNEFFCYNNINSKRSIIK